VHFKGGLMKATFVDLRHKMKAILSALRRNEEIQLIYHGKPTAKIVPIHKKNSLKSLKDHPFFGSKPSITKEEVDKIMDELRGGRYRDL